MDTGISLTDALRKLREELYAAQDEGALEQFQFEVEKAELSLEVEFRRDGNGRVKVEVGALGSKFGGEAGGGLGATGRQTLTLTLQVHDEARGGTRAKIRRSAGAPGTAPELEEQSPEGPPSEATSGSSEEVAQLRPWEL